MPNDPALVCRRKPSAQSHRCLPYRDDVCQGDSGRAQLASILLVQERGNNWLGGDAIQKERLWEEWSIGGEREMANSTLDILSWRCHRETSNKQLNDGI